MTTERIFNVFIDSDVGIATEYGLRHHQARGSDKEKTDHLTSYIDKDHTIASRFRLHRNFTPLEWRAVLRRGHELEYFEDAFMLFGAPASPVFCITSVVDGTPIVDNQIGPEPYRGDVVTAQEGWGSVPD